MYDSFMSLMCGFFTSLMCNLFTSSMCGFLRYKDTRKILNGKGFGGISSFLFFNRFLAVDACPSAFHWKGIGISVQCRRLFSAMPMPFQWNAEGHVESRNINVADVFFEIRIHFNI